DDGVGAHLFGVTGHQVERLLAGVFAHLRPERDVTAEEALDSGAERADDRAGADDDAADDAERTGDAITGKLLGRGRERVAQHGGPRRAGAAGVTEPVRRRARGGARARSAGGAILPRPRGGASGRFRRGWRTPRPRSRTDRFRSRTERRAG